MISGVSAPLVQSFRPSANSLAAGQGLSSAETPGAKDGAVSQGQLTDEEKKQVEQLKKTDREVRAHEQAHKNAGGQFAGAATFGFQVGPDGRRYAVSGEVPIDIAPVKGDPQATIAKMNAVAAAALAPAKPSGQDRKVAAQAAAIRAEAQAELSREFRAELSGADEEDGGDANSLFSPAFAAYDAGSSQEKSEKSSGNIIDIIS